jgi:anti-anti-sigma factor
MSIRLRLIAIFSLNFILLLTIGIVMLAEQSRMNVRAQGLANTQLPAIDLLGSMTVAFATYRELQLNYRNSTEQAAIEAQMAEIEAQVAQLFRRYIDLATDTEQRALFAQISAQWDETLAITRGQLIPASQAGNMPGAVAALERGEAIYRTLLESIERIKSFSRSQAEAVVSDIQNTYQGALSISVAVMAIALMLSAVTGFSQALDLSDQLRRLVAATGAVAAGSRSELLPIESRDEMGQVASSFNHLVETLQAAEQRIEAQQMYLTKRNQELESTLNDLQQANEQQARLRSAIQAISMPVVRVAEGTLVLPLIGSVDDERAALLMQTLLRAVEREQARRVLIDVTGVPVIDSAVAQLLIHAAAAVRLLGAKPTLVGIRPELAQTLVSLGVDLSALDTRADLASGLRG